MNKRFLLILVLVWPHLGYSQEVSQKNANQKLLEELLEAVPPSNPLSEKTKLMLADRLNKVDRNGTSGEESERVFEASVDCRKWQRTNDAKFNSEGKPMFSRDIGADAKSYGYMDFDHRLFVGTANGEYSVSSFLMGGMAYLSGGKFNFQPLLVDKLKPGLLGITQGVMLTAARLSEMRDIGISSTSTDVILFRPVTDAKTGKLSAFTCTREQKCTYQRVPFKKGSPEHELLKSQGVFAESGLEKIDNRCKVIRNSDFKKWALEAVNLIESNCPEIKASKIKKPDFVMLEKSCQVWESEYRPYMKSMQ